MITDRTDLFVIYGWPVNNTVENTFTEMLFDSVAPLVNTISFGSAPIKSATCCIKKNNTTLHTRIMWKKCMIIYYTCILMEGYERIYILTIDRNGYETSKLHRSKQWCRALCWKLYDHVQCTMFFFALMANILLVYYRSGLT